MKEILVHALENHYGVAQPSIVCELNIRGCINTAEELKAPIILGFNPSNWGRNVPRQLMYEQIQIARYYAQKASVPVAIHRDHAPNFEECIHAIHQGMTSVMIDASEYSLEENIRRTKEVVRVAHAIGLTCEAELGHVGAGDVNSSLVSSGLFDSSSGPMSAGTTYTDPSELKTFVEMTEADCVAVSIGNLHGRYKNDEIPVLDFDLLSRLHEAAPNTPLVMHGGSGTGYDNLKKSCEMGICKVNIGHSVVWGGEKAIFDEYEEYKDVVGSFHTMSKGYNEALAEHIICFGGQGKAWNR